mgnify:CR=1 FL=1
MTTPTPAREIDELLNRLVAIVNFDTVLANDELVRLQWQARKLLRSDPADAHTALGIIAAMRLDETTAEREFLRARDDGGWNPFWALNFATMLGRFHRVEEALHQTLDVVQQGPGPFYVPALEKTITWAYAVGRLRLVAEILESLRKHATAPLPDKTVKLDHGLASLVKAADELELTDDQMAAIQAPVWALIREKRLAEDTVALEDGVHNDGSLLMTRLFKLSVSFEELLQMEEALVKAQSEQEDILPIWNFSVGLQEREAA